MKFCPIHGRELYTLLIREQKILALLAHSSFICGAIAHLSVANAFDPHLQPAVYFMLLPARLSTYSRWSTTMVY